MNKSKLFAFFIIFITSIYAFGTERPIIRDLIASGTKGTNINLSWTLPQTPTPAIKKLYVYKNSKPIVSYFDITEIKPIAELDSNSISYSDTVKNYNDYYYAVIASTKNGIYDIILPSINSTVSGTHLKIYEKDSKISTTESAKEKTYPNGGIRETPLPYLDLIESQNKKPLKMNDSTYLKARKLGKSNLKKEKSVLEPYIFEEDLVSPEGDDSFLLFEVLRTTFIQRKYKESIYELERLIGTNRSKDVINRAIFYLGESYYYSKDYKNATTNFLKVYEVYPSIARRWIDSSLDLYSVPKEN